MLASTRASTSSRVNQVDLQGIHETRRDKGMSKLLTNVQRKCRRRYPDTPQQTHWAHKLTISNATSAEKTTHCSDLMHLEQSLQSSPPISNHSNESPNRYESSGGGNGRGGATHSEASSKAQ